MMISVLLAAAAIGFVPPAPAVAAPASGPGTPNAGAPTFTAVPGELEFSGELIVRPKQTLSPADRVRAQKMVQRMSRRYYAETDEYIVTAAAGPELAGTPEQQVSAQLMKSGLFQYAHPNWIVYPTAVPNDPRYGDQWHHVMMQSAAAWTLHTGNPSTIVAVTDTGIVTHEDLPNRVFGYNAVSQVEEEFGGDLTDINGHGTHVAGCAAARGNNSLGVSGMGWNLSIMPIRVSEAASGGASYEAILGGARWAAEHGAVTASASYSGIGYDAIETTGEYMNSLGTSFLWAAGNSATDHRSWDFDHVLVIGASDSGDLRASFSSFGRGVDCFAPGVSILSTVNSGGYNYASGTSMATPVANGALGMIRSANPLLSVAHAEYILLHTCVIWGGEQDNEQYGFGRVNLFQAVSDAINAFVPAAPIARNDRVKSVTGQTVVMDVLNNDYDRNMDPLQILAVPAQTTMGDALVLLPGGGPGGRDAVQVNSAGGQLPGTRSFVYTLREPVSGATAQATAFIELSAPRPPENPLGDEAGLSVSYYALSNPSALPDWSALTPFLTEVAPDINYASTDGNYAGSGLADGVGAVYDGWLTIPTSGLWTLNIRSDDGSRVRIGDTIVVNNDGLHGMVTQSATVALGVGKHRLRVEFFENGGGAGLIFSWSGPNVSTDVVPSWALSHGGTLNPADLNHDGSVDGADLGALLGAWGPCAGCSADLNHDGTVDGADLGMLLGLWGP